MKLDTLEFTALETVHLIAAALAKRGPVSRGIAGDLEKVVIKYTLAAVEAEKE